MQSEIGPRPCPPARYVTVCLTVSFTLPPVLPPTYPPGYPPGYHPVFSPVYPRAFRPSYPGTGPSGYACGCDAVFGSDYPPDIALAYPSAYAPGYSTTQTPPGTGGIVPGPLGCRPAPEIARFLQRSGLDPGIVHEGSAKCGIRSATEERVPSDGSSPNWRRRTEGEDLRRYSTTSTLRTPADG